MRAGILVTALVLGTLAPSLARADDVADEADLQFALGAEQYQKGDYRAALAHFLASNRLAKNRNVEFNIGRSYEQLSRFPEAFRWYAEALEGETLPSARARVEEALSRVRPNVASVRIVSEPPGATIYVGRKDLGPRGNAPRTLGLGPGRYTIIAELEGYEPVTVEVPELAVGTQTNVTLRLRPKPERLTGRLIVSTDEPGARVEVDGKPVAFTPAVVSLPAGRHAVTVAREGFHPVERTVEVGAEAETKLDLDLVPAEEVTAASRVRESVDDAPGSVSVVPSQELRAMAYPTIAEALRGVRGVYTWDDRSYPTLGFRGLGRLGGYGNRVLVLLDGQPTNDDWVGSSYVGYDARTDLEDVDHIEVVRGPGSVLYGTNAFSGVVNVVTRGRGEPTSVEAAASTYEYGISRGRVRGTLALGSDAGMWVSVAGAHATGGNYFFPEYLSDTPPAVAGNSRGADGFDSGTVNGRAWYKSLSAMWLVHVRDKRIPTGEFETLLADSRAHQKDSRAIFEVKLEPKLGDAVESSTRAYANLYQFRGGFPHATADGGLERDTFDGAWAGAEQRFTVTPAGGVRLTLGGEVQDHFHVVQTVADNSGTALDDSRPFSVLAGYALADIEVSRRVKASAGARFDRYSTFGSSLNPRASLVLKPYERGVVKVMGGKAFRAPSIYELYYNDGGSTQRASPGLSPESIYSAEIEWTHRFSPTVVGIASTWANLARDIVVARGAGKPGDPIYFENALSPLASLGAEAEVRREWRQGFMLSASYGYQRSRYLKSATLRDAVRLASEPTLREVENSPAHLAAFRLAAPVFSRAATLATRVSLVGPLYDRNESVLDPPQSRTDAALVWDLALSGREARSGFGWALGVYNVLDWRYEAPLSTEFRQMTLAQPGRTVFATVSYVR